MPALWAVYQDISASDQVKGYRVYSQLVVFFPDLDEMSFPLPAI